MIIFDLDGTLADCEHRRHHVQKEKPDWKSFYEDCDQDIPIVPVIDIWNMFISRGMQGYLYIFSGRCESVKQKTLFWIEQNLIFCSYKNIRMRPIGDNTPDDQLKEKWLDEFISQGHEVQMVFDDRKKVVEMWKRRGIFVFDVSQGKGNF